MKITSYILFLFFTGFFSLFQITKSHSQNINVDYFTIENGLSQTSVNCLIQDSRGFIWIGTQDGLNKYDGYSFKILKNQPSDSNSLSGSYINCIYEDSEGNIWVGTNRGLNKIDRYTEECSHYYSNPDNGNGLKEEEIYDLYQDKSGYIWIKTENYLSRLNPRSGNFRHYEHYNDIFNFISVNATFSIFEDHKNQLWVGTKDGLNYFDRKLEIFKRYRHDPENKSSISDNKVKVIFEDSDFNLWIGTEQGLNKFNWETEEFVRYYSDYENKESLSNNIINDIFEDDIGNLWIATDDGLNKFNKETETFTVYNKFLHDNEELLTTSFTDIIQDKTGIMWVGTLQGLLKINNEQKKFKLFDKSENNEPYFSNNFVTSMYKKNNEVWVGTWGTGLHLFDPLKKSVIRYNTGNSSIINDYIHKIFEDSNGDIWVGTQDGLSYFNSRTKRFENIGRTKLLNVFKNNRIFDILEDKNHNLWVGSKFGLHKISEDSIQSYFYNPNDSNSLAADLVYDLLIDRNKNLWIATENGLNKLDLEKGIVETFKQTDDCETCFSSNEILCIHEDKENQYLWLGTKEGLNRFDVNTGQVKIYTKKEGLPNNFVYSILPDNKGNLWMSTNRGLSRFNPEKELFINFGVSDGLQDFEFNHGASFRSDSGELFFGGIAGYNSFFPDSISKNQIIPNIEITTVEVLTEKVYDKIVVGKNRQIEIPYKNNLITIEFSALDFTNPEKNNYAYKVKGVENEWINLGNRRYATFSNLPPGNYTFQVKGSNSDYIWNETGTNLEIIVLTPLWKTNFAYLVYIILLAGIIFWFFQYRTRSLRRSNQELKEKEQIAKQIAKQKEELSVKNKNITDSIVYAKRIQEALLPPMTLFKRILPGSFILLKPKDIVSGDFYWINEKNNKTFIAVVDCTGHGVPGAFMSIIGFELLRKITDDQGIEGADEILQHLNDGVAVTFGKAAENTKLKDGMDIALCVIDKKKAELEYAGAFRPLYLIRDNKIEETRGDRFSVGLLDEGESDQITRTTIKLQKDDIFYMFSDGYADQFGGPDGKKYKYRRFRHLLLTIHKLPLEQQLTYFDRSFEDWKGELEQVDDVLIVGFRPELE
ncbi:MAG: SpoIIE family protein phosphatase [Bacteroidales bacterium]|nr:SpoIIE family protein phosphatase [Bacteroidales bacterium]